MQVALAWLAGRGRSFACGWEVAGSNLTLGGRGLLGVLGVLGRSAARASEWDTR